MIIAIVGPTGVGKTKLSLELAKVFNAIIINCDATQIYKELNIGSAKITKEEMNNIPHYLIDFVSPNIEYTVANYQKDARKIIEDNRDKNIIIVGGSGLYLKSLLYDYIFLEEENNNLYEEYSNDELYQMALQKDKECNIHPNNRQRLIRFLKRQTNNLNSKPLYNAFYIGLTTDRENLYNIINSRVDKMIQDGLVEEAKNLIHKYPESRILKRAIGYKELNNYFQNQCSLEKAIEDIKKNSRHYAKRQYTWFNNQMNIKWFNTNYENFSITINEVIEYIKKD